MPQKQTEIANFKSKLKEFAAFAEEVFHGNNECYKNELRSKVGHLFCKRQDSRLPALKSEPESKRVNEENVKVILPDEIWIKIIGFMKHSDVFCKFALICKHFYKLSLDPIIIKSLHLSEMGEMEYKYVLKVLKRSKFLKAIELHRERSEKNETGKIILANELQMVT